MKKNSKNKILYICLILAALLIICFLAFGTNRLKKSNVADLTQEASEAIEDIGIGKGTVKVAESNGKTLLIDTDKMIILVTDADGKTTYSSAVDNAENGEELALLSVTYLGEDNNLKEWNSYDNCVAFQTYQLRKLENGVQIELNLNEGESNRFYEYLPKKMAIETYDEVFKAGIKAMGESGEWDDAKVKRYLQTLSLVYKKSVMENCYAVTYTGTPPVSAVNQMIEIAKAVNYTQEDLIRDGEEFGFTVTFSEAANLDITVELTLENGELKASIPGAALNSENDFFSIQNIKLLPNFGAVSQGQEGYIFVPDGAGALFAFDSNVGNIRNYERPLYDNDFYKDYYFMPEYGEELFMPVYGMLYGNENKADKGFLAIVENGARNGYINVRLAGSNQDTSKYNKVFASFDTNQINKVKINGAYSESNANYLVQTGVQPINYEIRYKFFGKNTSYFELARSYGDYLANKYGIERTYDDGKAYLYLEAIGALSVEKRIAGVPYTSVTSMTDYNELIEILSDLSGANIKVQYDGVFNKGLNNKLNTKADLVSKNGSKKEFKAFEKFAADNDIDVFYQVNLAEIRDNGNGYSKQKHALRGYENKEVELTRYTPVLGILSGKLTKLVSGKPTNLLSPVYLSDVTDSFLKNADFVDKLAITDLANMYYADFRFRGFVTGEEGNEILNENLSKLSASKTLALKNPHMDKIGFGTIATDISRESSDYLTFAKTIPFRQLVLNGLVSYTTKDTNLSSRDMEYYCLQAAELNSMPKFTITAKAVGDLKDTPYSFLYSVEYKTISDNIKKVYDECSSIRAKIGTSEIIKHETLQDGVYKTTYANGVEVIVNYNLYDVTVGNTVVLKEKYVIKEK